MLPAVISREIEEGMKSFLRMTGATNCGSATQLVLSEQSEIRALQSGTVKRTVTDTMLPTGPIEREIIWHAPFTKCDRETDYATVWTKLGEGFR